MAAPLGAVPVALTPPLTALFAAIVLALVPSWRIAVWINVAASVATFVAALCLALGQPRSSAFLLNDPLAIHLVLLTSFVGATTALVSTRYVAAEMALGRLDRPRLRIYHGLFQALIGFVILALLSNNLAVTWMAMEAAVIAGVCATGLPATREAVTAGAKFFLLGAIGLAVALFGTVLLYWSALPVLGPGLPGMTWSALFAAAPRCSVGLLNVAFVCLLLGYGTQAGIAPTHLWVADAQTEAPTPIAAVLLLLPMNAALCIVLRLRHLLASNPHAIAPGPPLMAIGLLSLLVAAFGIWGQRDAKRFLAFSAIGQSGIVVFALGLGSLAGIFACLLQMTFQTLITAAALLCVGRAAQIKAGQSFSDLAGLPTTQATLGLAVAAAIVALAGLPPFGLFPSEYLILMETMRHVPWLLIPLGLGLAAIAWSMLARLPGLCLGPRAPDRVPSPAPLAATDVAPAFLHLLIALVLGFAMPGAVVAWFGAVAASAG